MFFYIASGSISFSGDVVLFFERNYEPTGSILVRGCSITTKRICLSVKYRENQILYLKDKAEKGLLRKIAVKKIILNMGKFANCFNKPYVTQPLPIYQDTLNSLHNEDNLIPKTMAVMLAKQYYEDQILDADDAINLLGC